MTLCQVGQREFEQRNSRPYVEFLLQAIERNSSETNWSCKGRVARGSASLRLLSKPEVTQARNLARLWAAHSAVVPFMRVLDRVSTRGASQRPWRRRERTEDGHGPLLRRCPVVLLSAKPAVRMKSLTSSLLRLLIYWPRASAGAIFVASLLHALADHPWSPFFQHSVRMPHHKRIEQQFTPPLLIDRQRKHLSDLESSDAGPGSAARQAAEAFFSSLRIRSTSPPAPRVVVKRKKLLEDDAPTPASLKGPPVEAPPSAQSTTIGHVVEMAERTRRTFRVGAPIDAVAPLADREPTALIPAPIAEGEPGSSAASHRRRSRSMRAKSGPVIVVQAAPKPPSSLLPDSKPASGPMPMTVVTKASVASCRLSKGYLDLLAKIEELEVQAEAARKAERAKAVAWIKEAIAEYGLSAKDLGFSGHSVDILPPVRHGSRSSSWCP